MPERVWIPGGRFAMGSEAHYPDEAPVREVEVDGFWIDRAPVTNDDFAAFVAETGYVTGAERAPTAEEFPGAPPENLRAGSMVFTMTPGPVSLRDHHRWWRWVIGADWRHPTGPDSSIEGLGRHPVVQLDPAQPQFAIPRRVIKGGSHLCTTQYCFRYRPAARQPQMIDTGTSHLGFRCISRNPR